MLGAGAAGFGARLRGAAFFFAAFLAGAAFLAAFLADFLADFFAAFFATFFAPRFLFAATTFFAFFVFLDFFAFFDFLAIHHPPVAADPDSPKASVIALCPFDSSRHHFRYRVPRDRAQPNLPSS
jgi:hypothetical protein